MGPKIKGGAIIGGGAVASSSTPEAPAASRPRSVSATRDDRLATRALKAYPKTAKVAGPAGSGAEPERPRGRSRTRAPLPPWLTPGAAGPDDENLRKALVELHTRTHAEEDYASSDPAIPSIVLSPVASEVPYSWNAKNPAFNDPDTYHPWPLHEDLPGEDTSRFEPNPFGPTAEAKLIRSHTAFREHMAAQGRRSLEPRPRTPAIEDPSAPRQRRASVRSFATDRSSTPSDSLSESNRSASASSTPSPSVEQMSIEAPGTREATSLRRKVAEFFKACLPSARPRD